MLWVIVGNILMLLTVLHAPRARISADLDVRRCYLEPRGAVAESRRHLVCWPRRGIFMAGDRALAWQVQAIRARR